MALALGLVSACREPAEPEPQAAAPTEPADVAAPETCRDWSTLDLTQLPPLVEGPQAPLLDTVWRRVLEEHYDPTLGCLPWGQLREVYARKVAESASDDEAYAHINAMLDELGQSHTRLYPPSRVEDAVGPAAPQLTVRWIEEQLVVVRSQATGPQGPVHAGATLLAINDEPVGPLVERVRGRSEPHAFPLAIARAAAARLSCDRAGQVRKLKVTDPTKTLAKTKSPTPADPAAAGEGLDASADHVAIRVVPCVEPQGERVTLGNLRDIPTHVEHRMLEADVGLLAFNVWMLPMVKEVSSALAELSAQGMRALVIDLRGNPGGVGSMVVPVARELLDRGAGGALGDEEAWPPKTASLGTLRFRDFTQELNVEPWEPPASAFDGPVVVLVDEGTASTSEIFVVGLRDLHRITVVGARPSAGSALPSVIEQLDGGALLQYVVADYVSPRGTAIEGKGIVPDVVVPETRDDFAAGRDPVLEAAHQHLMAQLAPPSGPNGPAAGPGVEPAESP